MKRPKEISNLDDIIDSRDVIARINQLESDREAANESALDPETDREDTWQASRDGTLLHTDFDEDMENEYQALVALADEAEGYAADWRHGETLIRDSYFKTYAQELAEDTGAVETSTKWPYTCIDWDSAAEELQADYTAVEFDGVTYWVR